MISRQIKKEYQLSEEQENCLHIWVETLLKWQKKVNLISPKTIDDLWLRHISDSLQLKPLLENHLSKIEGKKDAIYADFGSGAGFPSLAMALFWPYEVILVEADERKSIFLKEIVRKWDEVDRIKIYNQRIESLPKDMKISMLTARALAPLHQIFQWAYPYLDKNSTLILPKGKGWKSEIKKAEKHWLFQWEAQQSQTEDLAMILKVTQLEMKLKERKL